MTKTYCIYEHISPSGNVYVGQTNNVRRRWSGNGTQYLHKKRNGEYVQKVFARAILKYGWKNFKHKIILEGLDKSNADYAEIYLITWYKLHNKSYNMAKGGTGCNIHHHFTLEEKKKLSERIKANPPMKGKHHTPEALVKIIAANRNRIYTPEQKEKMRLSGKKLGSLPITEERREKYRKYRIAHPETWVGGRNKKEVFQYDLQGNFITSYPSAQDASIAVKGTDKRVPDICRCYKGKAASALGYIWRLEKVDHIDTSKYKIVKTKQGALLYDMSPESKLRRRIGHGKPVNQYSLDGKYITTYNSTVDASEKIGICHTTIGKCCNHKGRSKTAGGYLWEYDTGDNRKDKNVA